VGAVGANDSHEASQQNLLAGELRSLERARLIEDAWLKVVIC